MKIPLAEKRQCNKGSKLPLSRRALHHSHHSAHVRGWLTHMQLPAPYTLFSRKGRRTESAVPVWYTCVHTPVNNVENMKEKSMEQHTALPCWCLAHLRALHQPSSLSPGVGLSSQTQAPARVVSLPPRTGACFHLASLCSFLRLEVFGLPGYPQQTNTSVISGLRALRACELLVASQNPNAFPYNLGLPDPRD